MHIALHGYMYVVSEFPFFGDRREQEHAVHEGGGSAWLGHLAFTLSGLCYSIATNTIPGAVYLSRHGNHAPVFVLRPNAVVKRTTHGTDQMIYCRSFGADRFMIHLICKIWIMFAL